MRTTYSQEQLTRATHITKIIGDSSNLLILFELINFGEKSFNELKRMTLINPVTLSKKLNNLKAEGYVTCKSRGIENHYFVTEKADCLRPIIKDIEQLALEESK